MYLGAHESIDGGVFMAFHRAIEDGCEVLQIFTKNATQWSARPLHSEEVAEFKKRWLESGFPFVSVHDSYLINLAHPDDVKWRRSVEAFRMEMQRASLLGCQHLIFHPGAHLGSGERRGLVRIAQAIDMLLGESDRYPMLLLETTAGQGSNLGYTFEHIATIIDLVGRREMLAVCYDTCHTFAAGYDIRDEHTYGETFDRFDSDIGLDRLHAFHLNDSKHPLGSRKDRHEQIGDGHLGIRAFELLVNDERFRNLPGYLETPPLPIGASSYRRNLEILRSLRRL